MIQALNLGLEQLKELGDDFAEYFPFFLVSADEIFSDLLDVFDSVASVHLLALVMVLDAALGLADGTEAGAGYAAAHEHSLQGVQPAESVLLALHLCV